MEPPGKLRKRNGVSSLWECKKHCRLEISLLRVSQNILYLDCVAPPDWCPWATSRLERAKTRPGIGSSEELEWQRKTRPRRYWLKSGISADCIEWRGRTASLSWFGKTGMVLLTFLVGKVGKVEAIRSSFGARPQITVS